MLDLARVHVGRASRIAAAWVMLGVVSACSLSSGNEPRTYRGTNARPDLALRTAADDLACPVGSLLIATTLERRFSNTSAVRYVIDGCGERALYVEQCEVSDQPSGEGFQSVEGGSASYRCRYLLVSRVALPSRSALAPRASVPTASAAPATSVSSPAPTAVSPTSL